MPFRGKIPKLAKGLITGGLKITTGGQKVTKFQTLRTARDIQSHTKTKKNMLIQFVVVR